MNRRPLLQWMVAAALVSSVWAEPARPPKEGDFKAFASFVADSDVVFLDGAVVVEKRPGYRVKVNSSSLTPVPGKVDTYRIVGRVGGINEGKSPLRLATFIPLMEYREHPDAASQVLSVKVDGVQTRAFVFSGPLNQRAIALLMKTFPGNRLLETQIEGRTPNLFIPLKSLAPGKSILVEYELAPRSGLKVH